MCGWKIWQSTGGELQVVCFITLAFDLDFFFSSLFHRFQECVSVLVRVDVCVCARGCDDFAFVVINFNVHHHHRARSSRVSKWIYHGKK